MAFSIGFCPSKASIKNNFLAIFYEDALNIYSELALTHHRPIVNEPIEVWQSSYKKLKYLFYQLGYFFLFL